MFNSIVSELANNSLVGSSIVGASWSGSNPRGRMWDTDSYSHTT